MSKTTYSKEEIKRALLAGLSGEAAAAEMGVIKSQINRESSARPVFYVGAATCGISAGADKVIKAIEEYMAVKQLDAEIVEVGCVGLCSEEPILDVQMPGKVRVSYSRVTHQRVKDILDKVMAGDPPTEHILGQYPVSGKLEQWPGVPLMSEHPFFKLQTRWVIKNCGVINPKSIDEYMAEGGYQGLSKCLRKMSPMAICDEIEQSGLRGRGGGGFSTGKKWKFALGTQSDQKYMICNADEGDPGAFMDRAVIEGDPHRVLEGLAIASYAIGASKAYVYIRAEYPLAIERLYQAIAQAKEYGVLGRDILGSGFNLEIIIKKGAGAFVCGEETALIHSIEGKRGMPRTRPPFPAVSGLFGKPSVINNVETLANLASIIVNGKDWFNAVGTKGSKGTKVFALSGKITRTGLVEVTMGTKLRDIIFEVGGGIQNGKKYKAVQIGGPSGGCIPTQHLDIEIDYESLKLVGAMMGSGGLVVMDNENCMVDVAKFFMDFIQRESCGKCIPCREGTKQMLEILQSITRSRKKETGDDALLRLKGAMQLGHLANVIKDTALCGLGQTAPNPVLSTLRWFRDEYEAHIYERKCPAGVCKDLLTYSINQEKCVGCGACARKCPAGAIMGAKKTPHYVIPDKCIRCGACLEACKFAAVDVE